MSSSTMHLGPLLHPMHAIQGATFNLRAVNTLVSCPRSRAASSAASSRPVELLFERGLPAIAVIFIVISHRRTLGTTLMVAGEPDGLAEEPPDTSMHRMFTRRRLGRYGLLTPRRGIAPDVRDRPRKFMRGQISGIRAHQTIGAR